MATTPSKLATTLPASPIAPASAGPAAEAGVVQVNLGAETGQVVTGGEFGLATTMGTPNWSYASYADPAFQAVADQYPTDLLRHNWELHTMMDLMFPSRASASTPDFSRIDTFLGQQANLKGFFDNGTGTQIVTLGFPSWLNIADPADQALYAGMVKGIAQHFIDKGEPIPNYELVNEPDGHLNVTDLAHTFNAVADALHSVDPGYKLGGLSESYVHSDDLKTFFSIAGKNVGFVSWHQYVTGDSGSKSGQQEVTDSLNGAQSEGQAVRAEMRAAGIPDEVPLFLGEYNVDGGDYNDPANANMVGAVAAAATTYGMIHSNANFTMGALWDVQNDSAYSVFGHQGSYGINPVGVVLADLTAYMPGNMVRTTMPSDMPGLVGYTTKSGAGFSTALIDTSLSQGYTVDLSKDGLPTAGLYRVEVSAANPKGSRTALTDLSHVSVAAGSVVIVTNEAPHGGTELNGTTSTAPASAPAGTPDTTPTPPAAGGSTPAAQPAAVTGTAAAVGAAGPGSTSPSGSAAQAMVGTSATGTAAAGTGKAAVPTTIAPPPSGAAVAPDATSAGNPTPASVGASGSGTGGTKPDLPSAASSGTAAPSAATATSGAVAVQPAASTNTSTAAAMPGSTSSSGSATQAMAGATTTASLSASVGAGAAGTAGSLATAGSAGQFSVANGQIIGPDGKPFVARGINVFLDQADAATILKTFPGINAVRLATTPGADPAAIDALVKGLTSKGVVVLIEDHTSSGGNPNTLSGPALAKEASWYAGLAGKYQGNPYVWFGTANEPDNTADPSAVPAQEAAIYDAVRGAGSNAMVLLEMRGGFTNDAAQRSASTYAGMRNVAWDTHYYGWAVNQNTDPAAIAKALRDQVANAQSVKSADGTMPVVIGEYGPSTTGSGGYDANGLQTVQAVDDSGHGTFAWAWSAGTDALTDGSGGLTDFGQLVAKHLAAGASTSAALVAPTTDPAPATAASTPPTPASPSGSTPPAPVGTRADTLVLNLSEDAYQGDAQFQLTVDGKAAGPAQGVTALHGKGQSQAFTFKGDWSGAHRFGVTFTNDVWGGSADTDRNLYVGSATFDGTAVQGAAALYGNGAITFGTPTSEPPQAGAASQAVAVPAGMGPGGSTAPPATSASSGGSATPAPVGTGVDTLVLELSETAADGDAQFTLTIDGKPVGAAQGVTAAHGQGQPEAFAFKGDWGAGPHTVGVGFANPAAGSTADLARSLYLDSASFNATLVEANMQVTGNGPVTFALTPGATLPAPADAAGMPADTLTVTDDDGSSAAVPLVASGSRTDHPTGTSTVQQTVSGGTDTIASSGSVKRGALTLGAGTRKLVLANPRALVLTGGPGADTVAADSGANRFVAGSGSLDVTGGPGAAAYVLHAGSGSLTVDDFDPAKGDTLTVDKALQGALVQASDGHGGTLLAFGAKQGSIDLINHATVGPSAIRFI